MGKEQRGGGGGNLCTLDTCLISFTYRAVDVKKIILCSKCKFFFILFLFGYTIKIIIKCMG